MNKTQTLPPGQAEDKLIAPRPKYKREAFKTIIQQCGLKVTAQRLSILKTLNQGPKTHLTAKEIFNKVSKSHSDIGFATVYRFLKLITAKGVLSELKISHSPSRYELKSETHHHHITCVHCGKIIEFHNDKMEKIIEETCKNHKIHLEHHIIELYGVCDQKPCSEHATSSS